MIWYSYMLPHAISPEVYATNKEFIAIPHEMAGVFSDIMIQHMPWHISFHETHVVVYVPL